LHTCVVHVAHTLPPCGAQSRVVMQALLAHRPLPSFPTRRSSDLAAAGGAVRPAGTGRHPGPRRVPPAAPAHHLLLSVASARREGDRKSTRLNSSHVKSSYAVFCLKKKRTHTR